MKMPRNFVKTKYGDELTTRQVNYTSIQNDLILQKNLYSIYCLQSSLWILKYGYPASHIVINSKLLPRACILCITLFSPPFLKTYGQPTTISGSKSGIMRDSTNGHIDASPQVREISTMVTYLHVSPSKPLRSFNPKNEPLFSAN